MGKSIIRIKDVTKFYRMGAETIAAVNGLSLSIKQGEVCCLFGKSGSGKSTLLNLIAGLEKPTSGQIIFNKKHIERMNEDQLAEFRQKYVGFVFQSYNLLPTLTAMENVTLPLIFRGVPVQERNERAMEMLKAVGLEGRANHKPSEMSGGQQQRVSIARAFINSPQVVFADEPTGNLDVEFRDKFYETIRELAADENKCIIYATHLVEELEHFADYILWLQKKDNTTSKFYYGSLDELRDSYRLVSGDKTLLERIPKELVVGGRLSESSNELLIRYDEAKITAKINHEIRQHMRYAELKEIMYYVQKKEIIKESGDE